MTRRLRRRSAPSLLLWLTLTGFLFLAVGVPMLSRGYAVTLGGVR